VGADAGPLVVLQDPDSVSASFVAPFVKEPVDLVFQQTVSEWIAAQSPIERRNSV
jgi:hypothetical protein